MKFTARIDTHVLRSRMDMVRRGVPDAELHYVSALASSMARFAIDYTAGVDAIDTARYVRGWQLAHNQIPLAPPVPVTPLRENSKRAYYIGYYRRRLATYTPILDRVERQLSLAESEPPAAGNEITSGARVRALGRTGKKLKRIVERAKAHIEALLSEEGATAIVIGARARAKYFSLGSLGQVSTTIYGGRATVNNLGRGTTLTITNLEPHARLVEYGFRRSVRRGDTGEVIGTMRVKGRSIAGTTVSVLRGVGARRGDAVDRLKAIVRRDSERGARGV